MLLIMSRTAAFVNSLARLKECKNVVVVVVIWNDNLGRPAAEDDRTIYHQTEFRKGEKIEPAAPTRDR